MNWRARTNTLVTLGIVVLVFLLVLFGLSACASGLQEPGWTPRDTTAFEVPLPDGRTATCVYSNGAMACDFPQRSTP